MVNIWVLVFLLFSLPSTVRLENRAASARADDERRLQYVRMVPLDTGEIPHGEFFFQRPETQLCQNWSGIYESSMLTLTTTRDRSRYDAQILFSVTLNGELRLALNLADRADLYKILWCLMREYSHNYRQYVNAMQKDWEALLEEVIVEADYPSYMLPKYVEALLE